MGVCCEKQTVISTLHFILHTFVHSIIVFFSHTCPYHRNLFCCSTEMMSSNPSLSLSPLLGTLSGSFTPHIHLTILISARWSATSFFFLTGQVSFPCNILLRTQLLYNLPLTIIVYPVWYINVVVSRVNHIVCYLVWLWCSAVWCVIFTFFCHVVEMWSNALSLNFVYTIIAAVMCKEVANTNTKSLSLDNGDASICSKWIRLQ